MEKKRIKYVDFMKGLGIMMVTYGHITSLGNPVDVWMGSFKITIFFVAAGYLIGYTNSFERTNLKKYVKKLFQSLAVPYISFSVGAIIFRYLVMVMRHKIDMATIKAYLAATLTLRGVSTLWFLPTLFISEVLFFCIIKYLPKWARISLLVVIPIMAWYVDITLQNLKINFNALMYERMSFLILPIAKSVTAIWFLYIGYIGCRVLEHIQSINIRFLIGIAMTVGNILLSQYNARVDFNNMAVGEIPCLFFICGVIGSFGALLVFEFLEKYFKFEILNYFGKNSLILMATQRLFYIITIGTVGWRAISGMPAVLKWRYYIDCLGILAIVLMIEYTIITIINNKMPFVIGKFGKK